MSLLWLAALPLVVGYLGIVQVLRFKRLQALEKRWASKIDTLSYVEALEIVRAGHYFEHPFLITLSLSMALFQTYAIPTISKLLAATGQLSSPTCVGRRAEDTVVLLTEALVHGLDSERGSTAVARINWLHQRHGPKISNNDMLFTLSLFCLEPIRLCRLYEWRKPSALERQARFVWWREFGVRMGIRDIPETIGELQAWTDAYEAEFMVYAPSNTAAGEATLALLLRPLPALFRPYARQSAMVLLPDRVREAFGWPKAPAIYYTLIPFILRLRANFIRYFLLPRYQPHELYRGTFGPNNQVQSVSGPIYQRSAYLFEPWYTPVSFGTTLGSWLGYPAAGKAYDEQGYSIINLGPVKLEGHGEKETLALAEKVREGGL